MSDKMTPTPFGKMLKDLIREYREKKTFLDVPFTRNSSKAYLNAIGPAAGPHTQLAGNIIAAYAAGARYFELKTVQVLTGDDLGISKPCIYAATEVFNTEWSTELSVEEAKSEYIKAHILLKVLIEELELGDPNHFEFVMSVGYDLKGIQSPLITDFIKHMKNASTSREWVEDITYLLTNLSDFNRITETYVHSISPEITQTIALSTMHGCHKDEIEQIASYLLNDLALNVYVKMNPTLLGKETIRTILDTLGYGHIVFEDSNFELDIDFESAKEMLKRLQGLGRALSRTFGVKLTNTFPVKVLRGELEGETMYLSGPALFPMAIKVAEVLSLAFEGSLPISFSGGAEPRNIKAILETGISPVTVSSLLLKPSGYKNLVKLSQSADLAVVPKEIDLIKLSELSRDSMTSNDYRYREKVTFKKVETYSPLCAACTNCLDICPNRANRMIEVEGKKAVVRMDDLCNECGACAHYCIRGHVPYEEKLTLFSSEVEFNQSLNPSIYYDGGLQMRNTSPETDLILKTMNWEELL